jgi:hypothetical protein
VAFDVARVRRLYPALADGRAYLDGAAAELVGGEEAGVVLGPADRCWSRKPTPSAVGQGSGG